MMQPRQQQQQQENNDIARERNLNLQRAEAERPAKSSTDAKTTSSRADKCSLDESAPGRQTGPGDSSSSAPRQTLGSESEKEFGSPTGLSHHLTRRREELLAAREGDQRRQPAKGSMKPAERAAVNSTCSPESAQVSPAMQAQQRQWPPTSPVAMQQQLEWQQQQRQQSTSSLLGNEAVPAKGLANNMRSLPASSGELLASGAGNGNNNHNNIGQRDNTCRPNNNNNDTHLDINHSDGKQNKQQADGHLSPATFATQLKQTEINCHLSPTQQAMADQQPVPTPRSSNQSSLNSELSILTGANHLNQRLRDQLSASDNQSAGTPNSIMSDSTSIMMTDAMNSTELIPKLIERLDRKLIVMKEEQLKLMREIEANEATGQMLFESMKTKLTSQEYEKILSHANEIEKVTKLILSLKMRLKRVEVEIKEKSLANSLRRESSSASQNNRPSASSSPIKTFSANSGSNSNIISRGISDPTSTIGLPKRQHQHHASLQFPSSNEHISNPNSACSSSSLTSHSSGVGSSDRLNSPNTNHQKLSNVSETSSSTATTTASPTHQTDSKQTANTNNTSSDSIFNYADSAIGSTITDTHHHRHHGSSTNINQQHKQRSSQSPLSSNMSVSSHSSMLSSNSINQQQHSPPLMMSPASSTTSNTATSSSTTTTSATDRQRSNPDLANQSIKSDTSSFFKLPHEIPSLNTSTATTTGDEFMVHLLTDIDILIAKRNKLISQLEEAHQLEECIVKRNYTIIQRILQKYYNDDSSGEIAEFKQFTRLKSLLLKDTHDVADRIDNAELQLTELKQSLNHISDV